MGSRVAIVGGGMAGLAAAKALLSKGVACTLLDMGSRGVGGRVASRQLPFGKQGLPLSFDDGAPFFLASSPDFRAEVAGWAAAGAAAEWRCRQGRIAADGAFVPSQAESGDASSSDSSPRWVGVPANAAIPQHMAASLLAQHGHAQGQDGRPHFELLSGAAVTAMERVGGGAGCGSSAARWRLQGRRAVSGGAAGSPEQQQQPQPQQQGERLEEFGTFDAAILADAGPLLPGRPGHVEGLEASSPSLAHLARSVQDVAAAAQPRVALLAAFAEPLPGVPFEFAAVEHAGGASDARASCEGCGCGACAKGFGGAIHHVACNSSKPGRRGAGAPQCWVALSTGERAAVLADRFGGLGVHSEAFHEAVADELLADFRDVMAPFVQGHFVPQPAFVGVKWWGRAFVTQPLGAEFLLLPAQALALCGDAAVGSGVEKTWRSGRAAGSAVAAMLRAPTLPPLQQTQ